MGAPDDLYQLHHSGGVKEVHADEFFGALGGRGDGGDGDRRGVRSQNGLGLADAVQLSKDALLDLQNFNGCLHHQVGVGSSG